ncbi:dTMP kinase [Enhygromyxa salina]|uniref:Thymidylate kinase n=1 Tax=Enhygromyxa salina TaxID=215803 RepID=A0A2S9YMR1_9BACT|nr:dTMP kinase [Enhygromyxa salina]PRQ06375.1 Thymidylate kinase [Enhygromyxa salina]
MNEQPTAQAPRFVVFEGIDGSGTTTQQARVAERLRARGHRVHETREPSTGQIGELARALLAVVPGRPVTVDPAALALLFAADRLEHLTREVEPALARGEIVICDRYVISSWVYQSLECDGAWVRTLNARARWPDLTFVFDLDPTLALARVAQRRASTGQVVERFDVPQTQRDLARGYAEVLADQLDGVERVDASLSIDAVTEAIVGRCIAHGL